MRLPLIGSGHNDSPVTFNSFTARRTSCTAKSTSCSVISADALRRSGFSLQKSVIQSFHALHRSLAYSGSNVSSQCSGEVLNSTAMSRSSLSRLYPQLLFHFPDYVEIGHHRVRHRPLDLHRFSTLIDHQF